MDLIEKSVHHPVLWAKRLAANQHHVLIVLRQVSKPVSCSPGCQLRGILAMFATCSPLLRSQDVGQWDRGAAGRTVYVTKVQLFRRPC